MEHLAEIAAKFLPCRPEDLHLQPIENGLINQTFLVTAPVLRNASHHILQRVNHRVFPDPEVLVQNAEQVHAALAASDYPLAIYHFLKTPDGAAHTYDAEGWPWRMLSYIPDSQTVNQVDSPDTAYRGAAAFSLFYRHLNRAADLHLTPAIPGFIQFQKRLDDYRRALSEGLPERLARAAPLIAQVQPHLPLPNNWIRWQASGVLPRRVIHADPKISNVLFHAHRDEALTIIDLDTVMHGTLLYDFGDMARSYSSTTAEDDSSTESPFSSDRYQAAKAGFLSHLDDLLEPVERENLDYAAAVVVLIQCLRFLTDYLNGDVYYHTARPEQNLDRALNQFRLFWGVGSGHLGQAK